MEGWKGRTCKNLDEQRSNLEDRRLNLQDRRQSLQGGRSNRSGYCFDADTVMYVKHADDVLQGRRTVYTSSWGKGGGTKVGEDHDTL